MKALLSAFALLAALTLPTSDAVAQDPATGRALAARHCAKCHAIAPGETSPAPRAPAFDSFGGDWLVSALAEALAEGIMVAHSDPPMPEFSFTPREIDDLIAYLESIAASRH